MRIPFHRLRNWFLFDIFPVSGNLARSICSHNTRIRQFLVLASPRETCSPFPLSAALSLSLSIYRCIDKTFLLFKHRPRLSVTPFPAHVARTIPESANRERANHNRPFRIRILAESHRPMRTYCRDYQYARARTHTHSKPLLYTIFLRRSVSEFFRVSMFDVPLSSMVHIR